MVQSHFCCHLVHQTVYFGHYPTDVPGIVRVPFEHTFKNTMLNNLYLSFKDTAYISRTRPRCWTVISQFSIMGSWISKMLSSLAEQHEQQPLCEALTFKKFVASFLATSSCQRRDWQLGRKHSLRGNLFGLLILPLARSFSQRGRWRSHSFPPSCTGNGSVN